MKYFQIIQKYTKDKIIFPIINQTQIKNNLGRWTIHYDTEILDKKIDQANEDHCGCCLTELKPQRKDLYYLPFILE